MRSWRGRARPRRRRAAAPCSIFPRISACCPPPPRALAITGQVALAGCAVGAAIELHFAARNPERALGVVAMGPATGVPPERRAQVLALADNVRQVGMRGIVEASFAASYPSEVRHDAEHYA